MAVYRLNNAALNDLDRIYEYGIQTFGLEQADSYYDGLVAYFQAIAENPLSYVSVGEIRSGYRRATYFTDSVYYRIETDRIVIVRILGRQDPFKAFGSAEITR